MWKRVDDQGKLTINRLVKTVNAVIVCYIDSPQDLGNIRVSPFDIREIDGLVFNSDFGQQKYIANGKTMTLGEIWRAAVPLLHD